MLALWLGTTQTTVPGDEDHLPWGLPFLCVTDLSVCLGAAPSTGSGHYATHLLSAHNGLPYMLGPGRSTPKRTARSVLLTLSPGMHVPLWPIPSHQPM